MIGQTPQYTRHSKLNLGLGSAAPACTLFEWTVSHLHEAHGDDDDDGEGDGGGVVELPHEHRDDGGGEEQQDERVVELLQVLLPQRVGVTASDLVAI